jgi:hypothetical protein
LFSDLCTKKEGLGAVEGGFRGKAQQNTSVGKSKAERIAGPLRASGPVRLLTLTEGEMRRGCSGR